MVDTFVFANRAVTALQDSVDQFATSFDFGVDDLDRFPTLSGGSKFPIILSDREDVFEICYVTALTVGGEATVERAQEGTAALSWSAGTFVEHCMTAGSFLAAARLVPKGEWSAATNYVPGDVVEYTDISYIAVTANLNQVPSAASTYWQTLYVPPGVSSTALSWSGDWNSGVTYAIGALVKYQGKLYVAIAAGLNHLPSDASWWYPLAMPPDAVTYDNVLTAAGTNNYTVSPSPAPAALFDGMELSIIFSNTNTAACTLTIGALAPQPLRWKVGVDFGWHELPAGTLLEFVYRSGTGEFIAKMAPVWQEVTTLLAAADAALDTRLDALEGREVPVGAVMDFAGATAPSRWLLCYGQELLRTTYSALDAVIGTTYGAYTDGAGGVGTTHLRLPDCRGRVTAGQDDMGGASANRLTGVSGGVDGDVLGGVGGAETHTLTEAQMPAHDHGGATNNGVNDGNHTHTYTRFDSQNAVDGGPNGGFWDDSSTQTTGGTGAHQHAIASDGGGGAHNNVQPTIVFNKIIFTSVA
jgi:microcystin-dependent protein